MGLRDRVTQPYIDAQQRMQNALDLEARAAEFEERARLFEDRVADAVAKAEAAKRSAEGAIAAANARVDAVVSRLEERLASLDAVVASKTPVKQALLKQLVDEAVRAAVDARAAQLQESYRVPAYAMSASHYPQQFGFYGGPGAGYR